MYTEPDTEEPDGWIDIAAEGLLPEHVGRRITVLIPSGPTGVLTSWRPMTRRRNEIAGIAHIDGQEQPVALRRRTRLRIHLHDTGSVVTGLLVLVAALCLLAGAVTAGVALGRNSVEPTVIGVPVNRLVVEERTQPPVTVPVTEWRTRYIERGSRTQQRSSDHGGSRGVYQDYARSLVPTAQWPCLRDLWQRESGWNPAAVGPLNDDGKYPVGIPQLKGLAIGTPWRTQIVRGLDYIEHRYGTPCAAWSAFGSKGWY